VTRKHLACMIVCDVWLFMFGACHILSPAYHIICIFV
jgi:hypothetical protein